MFMMFLRLILIARLMRLGSLISLALSLKMSRDILSRCFQELLFIFLKTPLHSNFRLLISSICASRGLMVYMSFNESRFDKNESRVRKPSGGRSGRGSGGQQRNFLSRRGRGGGSNPTTITAPPDLNT